MVAIKDPPLVFELSGNVQLTEMDQVGFYSFSCKVFSLLELTLFLTL